MNALKAKKAPRSLRSRLLTAVLVYDGLFYEWQVFTFVMRKFLDLTEYIAFWR